MSKTIRILVKEPGQKLREAFLDPAEVKGMMEGRLLQITTDMAILDDGKGKANGSVLGIPLFGRVVVAGVREMDGAVRPCGLALRITPKTLTRLIPSINN